MSSALMSAAPAGPGLSGSDRHSAISDSVRASMFLGGPMPGQTSRILRSILNQSAGR